MMSLTIRRRILLSFALVLAVMSGMAALSYAWFTQAEREAIRVETDTVPGLYLSAQLMTTWGEGRGLAREFLLSDTSAEKGDAAAAIAANRDRMHEILKSYDATIMSEEDRRNYAQAVRLFDEFVAAQQPVVAAGRVVGAQGWTPERIAAARTELAQIATRVDAAIATMLELNKTRADQSTRTIVSIVRAAELGLLVSFGLALGLAVLFGYLLFRAVTVPLGKLLGIVEVMRRGDFSERLSLARRDEFSTVANGINAMADDLAGLIGQIQKSGIQVNTSITEVAATSKEQQATASEIAATTTEIGATAKEISATSNELVRTMDEVSEVAEQTAKLAGGGQAGLSRMESTMQQVMEAAGAINAKLAILSEKAGNINQVVTTITKVADQTNLLSLNAAIEAEKAGQYGRGFAVVATEIRRLADQTAVSTYDIEQMVKDIQSAVAAGVMGMDKFSEEVRRGMQDVQQVGGQLSDIIEQVQGLVPRFEVANEGMQAQAAGAGQISEALVQLGEAAQQTVESLQQSTLAIDELNQVSTGLRSSIARFKLRA
ncbi:methyl-accepting chemotaxis protein [Bosea sp. (in: a-proteobacteria)]|uniref:methyl-accepting chemotaxis protein n=1 Tax=Bosea sp. (in: a-proteobacteria) TaxID=1871050 RepID=UPI001AC80744|nr:methyl-accepting chemotaxis protein [Bosea sp. (in: a-proteobacteria)]MBN9444772.1 methyl-accepting chemotaxis protein [Bosea sp. (in: a-proteobacteria)]